MEKFIIREIKELPKTPGVYCFKDKEGRFLYIGKAASLKSRAQSHFSQPSFRDNLFIKKVSKIGFIETGSEIEALILEAELIKKYQPKYNVLWRDDKNYFFVAVTKEDFPRVFICHQTKIKNFEKKNEYVGPFVEGAALKKTMRMLRRIFPYYSSKTHPKRLCPWCHLGLCPGPNPLKSEYKKSIRNLKAVLKGKSGSVLKNLRKEMELHSKKQEYEKAGEIKAQIQALESVLAHAKVIARAKMAFDWQKAQKEIMSVLKTEKEIRRAEAYDVSNIQGKEATASMVVFMEGRPDKNLYRKFKIKFGDTPNDTAMLKEAVSRRLRHEEWPLPDFMLMDGGKGQLSAAVSALEGKKIKVAALAKRNNELFLPEEKNPCLLENLQKDASNFILQLRDEAHRFAVSYHRNLRKKSLKG
jgi:excinuclease ABC subunit C